MIPLPDGRVKGASGAAARALRAPARALRAPVTRPPARRTRQLSRDREQTQPIPRPRWPMTTEPQIEPLRSQADAGKAVIWSPLRKVPLARGSAVVTCHCRTVRVRPETLRAAARRDKHRSRRRHHFRCDGGTTTDNVSSPRPRSCGVYSKDIESQAPAAVGACQDPLGGAGSAAWRVACPGS